MTGKVTHAPWFLDGVRWACKHPDATGRFAWTSPPCPAALPLPCFCGQPEDRERVHRSHACERWVTDAVPATPEVER